VVGRIGSILAPLTPILAQEISPRAPLVLFSALAFSSSFLMTALPETLNKKMPDNVKETFDVRN
jgi:hypothetical protein